MSENAIHAVPGNIIIFLFSIFLQLMPFKKCFWAAVAFFRKNSTKTCIAKPKHQDLHLDRAGIRYFLYQRYRYLVLKNGSFGLGIKNGSFGLGISVNSWNRSFGIGISVMYFGR